MGEDVYCIEDESYLTQKYRCPSHETVAAYFTEVIREVCRTVGGEDSKVIDLSMIMELVLPSFLEKWERP